MPESCVCLRCCLQRDEIPQGTLDLLILKTLALQRMLIKGWLTAEWGVTAGHRARYYMLTAAGRKQLALELSQFERVIGAITRVIQTA
jgi:hypothetical protein